MMITKNAMEVHWEEIEINQILKSGRNKFMSLLNLNLNISYFNIDIQINRNEDKKKEKMQKKIVNDMGIHQELERRRNQEYQYMLYHMIKHN